MHHSAVTVHRWDDVIDDATRRVYAAYERERRVGERPALLAIDLYDAVFEGGPQPVPDLVERYPSSCGVHAHEAIAPIQRLLAAARARVVDAYSYGFHVTVVEECCFERSLLSRKVNLFNMHQKYADVMHLDDVERHLLELRARAAV